MPRIAGAGGEIRAGYQVAGTIAAWTVTTTSQSDGEVAIDLEFTLAARDPYWSTQRPLTVILEWFGRRRVWRNVAPV